jgi:hypothetical protein
MPTSGAMTTWNPARRLADAFVDYLRPTAGRIYLPAVWVRGGASLLPSARAGPGSRDYSERTAPPFTADLRPF